MMMLEHPRACSGPATSTCNAGPQRCLTRVPYHAELYKTDGVGISRCADAKDYNRYYIGR